MYKPKHSPLSDKTSELRLPNPFSLISWNLQKVDFSIYQPRKIEQLLNIEEMHILSLQEARIHENQRSFFGLPFCMAPNIETPNNVYGALTASAYQLEASHQFLTASRELGFATHKPAIITQHSLANKETLTHVNIHAINFVPHYIFKKELKLLLRKIEDMQGPLIISGDFNTWNRTRLTTLLKMTNQLELQMVDYPDIRPIKTLNRQPLDHIFYRGLTLNASRAISVPHISDHNPIIAEFSSK